MIYTNLGTLVLYFAGHLQLFIHRIRLQFFGDIPVDERLKISKSAINFSRKQNHTNNNKYMLLKLLCSFKTLICEIKFEKY